MKFFIINSFRFLVYIAYFGIIALYAFGAYIERDRARYSKLLKEKGVAG